MLCHKTSLNTFKNIAVVPGIFSYLNGTKVEINNRMKTEKKITNMQKFNNGLKEGV